MNVPSLSESLQQIGRSLSAQAEVEVSDVELLRRFTTEADQSAFATIVQRHGPMVLNVCRRILSSEVDAEDAFQATFVVLSKKASTLRQGDLLANWLHGVARRTAMKARGSAFRRFQQEWQAAQMRTGSSSPSQNELSDVLDEELRRLPVKFRAPLLLCYMEGKSREEAARQLGCTPGAVKGNLERGRDLLRKRLTERGVACASAVLLGTMSPASALPPNLVSATMQAVAGGGSTTVAWLATHVSQALVIASTKTGATALVLAFALLGAGWVVSRNSDLEPTQVASSSQVENGGETLPSKQEPAEPAPATNAQEPPAAPQEPKEASKNALSAGFPKTNSRPARSRDRCGTKDPLVLAPDQDGWLQILEIRMQTNSRGNAVKVEIRVFEKEEEMTVAQRTSDTYLKRLPIVPVSPVPSDPVILSKSEPSMW